MTEEDSEISPCPSKTGRATRKTGKRSADPSESEPAIAAKEAPLIQTAGPETESHTPLLEVGLCLPSPTLTTIPATAIPLTSEPGASAATLLMTPSTTRPRRSVRAVSRGTTDTLPCLSGGNDGKKKLPTRSDLMKAIRNDELALHLHQLQLEAYKPAMDALKLYLEIFGSQSPNFYMTKNRQIAASCQMNGINDPDTTRKQRIAAMTCYEMLAEAIMKAIELGLDKEEVKQMMNDAINSATEFFNLGNKKAVKAREKRNKK
jgi:hypothetical protein